MNRCLKCIAAGLVLLTLTSARAAQTGEPFVGRTDPNGYTSVDCGGGIILEQTILPGSVMDGPVSHVVAGILPARSGIGMHTHDRQEEMYILLDGPVVFTLDGSTAILPARAAVLCPPGATHALYNHGDTPLHYLRLGVATDNRYKHDPSPVFSPLSANPLAGLTSPPAFRYAVLDCSLMQTGGPSHLGHGTILYRRPWNDGNFATAWQRLGHAIIPPGHSIGYHAHPAIEETYILLSGSGSIRVNGIDIPVRSGDAVPCTAGDSHGLLNNSPDDIDLIIFNVALVKNVPGEVINHGDDLLK